jgi:type I restriction enzyme S subunit
MCSVLGIATTINQNMAALVPRRVVNSTFLYYFMTAAYEDLRQLGRGANQPALNCEILGSYKIALPPIEEQTEISNQLRRITETTARTIAFAESQQDLLQERRTALISAAVTGKIDVRGWKRPSSVAKLETEINVE